jgi:competence protein ComEA
LLPEVFNPNKASSELLISLGLPISLSKRIVNYRSKGGSFKIKSDIKKIYGFTDSLFSIYAPYIDLPDVYTIEKGTQLATFSTNKKDVVGSESDIVKSGSASDLRLSKNNFAEGKASSALKILDINEADSSALIRIKGIGPKISARIIKYRNSLGGFISMQQLDEIYGLIPEVREELIQVFYISVDYSPAKISINNADFQSLSKHPYIGYQKAKAIINYRDQHGAYYNVDDLMKVKLLAEEEIIKFAPYITF